MTSRERRDQLLNLDLKRRSNAGRNRLSANAAAAETSRPRCRAPNALRLRWFSCSNLLLTDGFLLRLLREHYVFFVGLPIAALISFVIVSTFETTRGDIQFELGGLKFKGASGPIVMWVLAYVTLIASVSLVWPLH
jgi:hypothetical protein